MIRRPFALTHSVPYFQPRVLPPTYEEALSSDVMLRPVVQDRAHDRAHSEERTLSTCGERVARGRGG